MQCRAATSLGWSAETWDQNQWPLPHNTAWDLLDEEVRCFLEVLGETADSWEGWKFANEETGHKRYKGIVLGNSGAMAERPWRSLSIRQRAAAAALGFTEAAWECTEMADLDSTISNLFGVGFEACVTQGCESNSIPYAKELCLSHPKVFASFGCHPKFAWSYDDQLEKQILQAIEECGQKAVAWGECGLDYSHPFLGKSARNRRLQKEVLARQLPLAIACGLPLVLHSRGAGRDVLRLMRQFVPRDWKVHMHSWSDDVNIQAAMLHAWPHLYIGFSGLLTLGDHAKVEDSCRRCPLERILLETDSPYLPVVQNEIAMSNFSHPGQIPGVAAKVAELQGCSTLAVMEASRANARAMYGI